MESVNTKKTELVKGFLFYRTWDVKNKNLLKSCVSEICLKRIRVNQGFGVLWATRTTGKRQNGGEDTEDWNELGVVTGAGGSICTSFFIYSLMHKKPELSIFKIVLVKSSGKNFFTCILPDYVFHEIPKEFWKNNHFENMRASFLRRCQNSLWQTSHEMMHFQAW